MDCYAIALGKFDVVLGVQWLHTLGPILRYFDRLVMSFWRSDHRVTWKATAGQTTIPRARACMVQDLLADLLAEFDDLLTEPFGLPPPRTCDADMLHNGLIRHNTSEYPSPVLGKKQDGPWRFCVDYRTLNDKTVKDKFAIPIVDELLDELQGACFFAKLDLCSGYHQVWISSRRWLRM